MSDSDMFYCSFVSIHYIICECGKTFPSEEDLKDHLERDHPQKKEITEYRCGICDSPFDSQDECVDHYKTAHIGIKDEHDYVEVYSQAEEEQIHEAQDINIQDNNNISENVVVMTENVPEIHIPFDDDYEEEEVYEPVYTLPGTSDTEIVTQKAEKKPRRFMNKKKVVCEVCGRKYASNAALRYHQRVHTGEKPYLCTECPKRFTMPLFLQIHLRTHTGERPYQCPHCPKAFSNKAALLRHDRVHTGIKPYGCPRCGKYFTQSNSMKLHVNTVHLKMPAPYKSKSRKNKQREKEMYKEAMLRAVDNESETAADTIKHEMDDPNVYIKPEVVFKEEVEEDVLLEDDGEDLVTYEVVFEE